jgi:hypothetical protein
MDGLEVKFIYANDGIKEYINNNSVIGSFNGNPCERLTVIENRLLWQSSSKWFLKSKY